MAGDPRWSSEIAKREQSKRNEKRVSWTTRVNMVPRGGSGDGLDGEGCLVVCREWCVSLRVPPGDGVWTEEGRTIGSAGAKKSRS